MKRALARVLAPLVRASIAQGLRYPELSDLLKEIYFSECENNFRLENKRLTDSRISLLTGLHRRDVKSLRTRFEQSGEDGDGWKPGLIPRVLAHWSGGRAYSDGDGVPLLLPRSGDGPSFAALMAEVSQDVHHRTILDELAQLGLVDFDTAKDTVRLVRADYVPTRDTEALTGYLGANVGDHAEAAVENILAQPNPGPFFERALHYNNLCADSIDEIEASARKMQAGLLSSLNEMSLQRQKRDQKRTSTKFRFRFGAYFYRKES